MSHTGGSECTGWCHSLYFQCAAGVSDILAHLQHYGSQSVCWEVLPLHQHHHRGTLPHGCGQQQEWLYGPDAHQWGALGQCEGQLWQCGTRLPLSTANCTFIMTCRVYSITYGTHATINNYNMMIFAWSFEEKIDQANSELKRLKHLFKLS